MKLWGFKMSKMVQDFKNNARQFANRLLDNPSSAVALTFGAVLTASAIVGGAGYAAGHGVCALFGAAQDATLLGSATSFALTATAAAFVTCEAMARAMDRAVETQRKKRFAEAKTQTP
jgi:membrane protein implicated in regulation of membrane protease activity